MPFRQGATRIPRVPFVHILRALARAKRCRLTSSH